ncbi:MAG TPA: sulfate reduction electron transfer complex DsrMKJOP subunit DsrM [Syntrophales bacterium]|nr:sulfate reduction electron transfer complex DsrMKJOP subunit DsrM [Syntrophales bacterium]
MNLLVSLCAIVILILSAVGVAMITSLNPILFVVIPCGAFAAFVAGFAYRIVSWGRSPVPFSIPTTCGQQKSLPWIKCNALESPPDRKGVIGRMALEVLLFRSLFRNTRLYLYDRRPVYSSAKWLWFFALLFHWSFLVIVLRHMRFFIEPVPSVINGLAAVDGFFEFAIPALFLSDAAIVLALTFLFLRRVFVPQLRYISLFTDYFAVLLILGVAVTGILMRNFFPVDVEEIKAMAVGWVTFAPHVPNGISPLFCVHLLFVSVLLAWFPWSKMMHMGGVFLSPTRNMANDSRMRRHINPWNAPVKVHTYPEYEDEFRKQMKEAGLPVDKE